MSIPESTRIRRASRIRIRKPRRTLLKKRFVAVSRNVFIVSIAVVVGAGLGYRVLRPFQLVNREQRERQQTISEYESLRRQNDDLRRQLRYLQTKEGVAQEARKHGFVKPGERSLVITDDPRVPQKR